MGTGFGCFGDDMDIVVLILFGCSVCKFIIQCQYDGLVYSFSYVHMDDLSFCDLPEIF